MPKSRKLDPMADWLEISATDADWTKIGKDEALKMHHHLHLVRAFEEMVLEIDGQVLIHGPAHSSIGQEDGAIGSISPLMPDDQVTGSHRGHHQFIAKALGYLDKGHANPLTTRLSSEIQDLLQKALAEIMGLAQGYCKGRGGSMHLRWADAGALGTNAIVGAASLLRRGQRGRKSGPARMPLFFRTSVKGLHISGRFPKL